jgi:hypothetical protein
LHCFTYARLLVFQSSRAFHFAELLDSYVNGSRTLSNDRISYLIISGDTSYIPDPAEKTMSSDDDVQNYDLLICAAHFIGDGMALHQFSHDFFTLLGSESSASELKQALSQEWDQKWKISPINDVSLISHTSLCFLLLILPLMTIHCAG